MDSLITAAARALAAGDPLGALKRVALRDDSAALALRGIAMAQLGDFAKSRSLRRAAVRAFSPRESMARARCIVAEAEVALVSRDLGWSVKQLDRARTTLEAHGDRVNAAHARYLEIRRLLLIGRLDEAERALHTVQPSDLPAALRTAHHLISAGIAVRRVRTRAAREALTRAAEAARQAGIPALAAEVTSAIDVLRTPAARLITHGEDRAMTLDEVETLFASKALVVDGCRNALRSLDVVISLARRPVLFALARALAEAWPADVARETLLARAFGARHVDESHRARLRVEIGRLRRMLASLASINATARGFALTPRTATDVVVLAQPIDDEHADVLALLSDGESWSTSALAMALSASQRTVQRALEALSDGGKAQAFGRGRARRWTTAATPGFTTTLLLPAPLPID
jgi:DNA-binding winged helix-turn-helix (wHTH) protein